MSLMRIALVLLAGWVSVTAGETYQTRDIHGWQILLDVGYQQGGEEERRVFDAVLME
ncbi:MAG TPA: hypothetical protein VHX44_09245 [Planctomycetota bacterium]|nr:hypothetical protein [Planctomycetota bacterium]